MLLHLITKTRETLNADVARSAALAAHARGRLTDDELVDYENFISGVVDVFGPNPPERTHSTGHILLPDASVAACVYVNENEFDDRVDWVGNVEAISLLTPDLLGALGVRIDRSTGLYETVPATFA